MTKGRLLLGAACVLTVVASYAIPARKSAFTITDNNGVERTVRLCGDESFHYYIDQDNDELLVSANGVLTTAEFDSKGRLVKSDRRVKASNNIAALSRAASAAPRRVPGLYENSSFPVQGHQKAVVVLVEYQDVKFNLSDPVDYFSRLLNEEGFSDYYATGSARDWYLNSSMGKFMPEFDVFGPVTLQKSQSYYGGNDAYGQDNAPQKMVIEACRLLNGDVDFSEYDRDGDGYIDNVFVVYAGRGEASGGSTDCVWPHAWTLNSAEPGQTYTFDGVRLNRYACCNEWELSDLGHGYRPVGVGTFIHEFNHVMGLPDLYSTAYVEGTFTPGAWDVMDYGPYNNDGCTPPQFSGWERAALGYIEPKTLPSGAANLAIGSLADGDCYIIPTDDPNEFFMLEHRLQDGWDTYTPNHGMLVWHIDYDADIWRTNTVNNDPAHNHVRLILADNMPGNSTVSGDCFPGSAYVTELSSTTTPALLTHAGKGVDVEISDIQELHGVIALRLAGGAADIAAPAKVSVSDIEAGYFTVSWSEVEGAAGYYVCAYPCDLVMDCIYPYWLSSEIFVPAGTTSFTVTDLLPGTAYEVSVRAADSCYGSTRTMAAGEIRTLDPTLDYYAPVAKAAASLTSDGFTATWDALDGATAYFVDVFRLTRGDEVTVTEHFDDLTAMTPGFSTNAAGSYGMASYAGESTPALRLAKDGDALTVASPSRLVTSISFWHRGNSTSDTDSIALLCFKGGEWTKLYAAPAVTEKGGFTVAYDKDIDDADEFKIVFRRNNKGAVAIDDVTLNYVAEMPEVAVEPYVKAPAGTSLSLRISGLEAGVTYLYTVTASDGRYTSLTSNKIEVKLPDVTAIADATISVPAINVVGRTVHASEPVDIYSIDGRAVAKSTICHSVPAAGLYIVAAQSGSAPIKIAIK